MSVDNVTVKSGIYPGQVSVSAGIPRIWVIQQRMYFE
jgi:hypothetical protein